MSFDAILPNDRLIVGDQETAKNEEILNSVGVTHIVACGFTSGFHETSGKYKYQCLNLPDLPDADLLIFLPKVTSFIDETLKSDPKHVVFIHCVHGQSRSCAVCVAYLMRCRLLRGEGNTVNLLYGCYDQVMQRRPCMAINPGFIRQLEIFRRMGCGLLKSKVIVDGCERGKHDLQSSVPVCKFPPQSRAHATFRSFRIKTKYHKGDIHLSALHPNINKASIDFLMNDSSIYKNPSIPVLYRCKKCRNILFSQWNIPYSWTELNNPPLPLCDYWKDTIGGKDAARFCKNSSLHLLNVSSNKENSSSLSQLLPLEPMQWMLSSMQHSSHGHVACSKGKLTCHVCDCKLGNWDWGHRDPFISTFVLVSKVDFS